MRDELAARGRRVEMLDGDEVRMHLSKGLGYTKEDRDVNVRRIGYVARLLSRNDVAVIVAAISPYRDVRDEIRRTHEAPFVEVYVECPIETLIERDRKGLYARAIRGEIAHFTGVSDPYEPPLDPDVHIRSDRSSVESSRAAILKCLNNRGLIGTS